MPRPFRVSYNQQRSTDCKDGIVFCAFDRRDGSIVLPPATSAFEAEYLQRFFFWCGLLAKKECISAGNLLVDFKDIALSKRVSGSLPDIQDKSSEEDRYTANTPKYIDFTSSKTRSESNRRCVEAIVATP